jgi:hypothetical protein
VRACEPAMLAMAMSAIFRAFGFDWKKAKWLKAEDPEKRVKKSY